MATKTKTIKSDGHIIGITKSTVVTSIYKIFYNYIHHNVTDPLSRTKWIYPTFPSYDIDEGKVDYPLIIIDSPEPTWDKLTFRRKWSNVSCRIEVYGRNAKQADELIEDVMNVFDTKWQDLYKMKIDMVTISAFDQDSFSRGRALRIHMRAIVVDCRYSWLRA